MVPQKEVADVGRKVSGIDMKALTIALLPRVSYRQEADGWTVDWSSKRAVWDHTE